MRPRSHERFVENPFIKPQNKNWSRDHGSSLTRSVSPPQVRKSRLSGRKSCIALVEAGEREIKDHLAFFAEKLQAVTLPELRGSPRLSHSVWVDLYTRSLNDSGHHFVVHQHDHPVAGTHYDLRLQCNSTSSISFAIMYGLPGDPNSRRLNRNATETRVHNLWNHLIETASHQTGTMLLWDTGEYEVLPYHEPQSTAATTEDDDSGQDLATDSRSWTTMTEQQKLHAAFRQRKLRLRLHGARLPHGYTISLRLTADNYRSKQPDAPKKRRRKQATGSTKRSKREQYDTTDSSTSADESVTQWTSLAGRRSLSSLDRLASPPADTKPRLSNDARNKDARDIDREPVVLKSSRDTKIDKRLPSTATHENVIHDHSDNDNEDDLIQRTNAYPGAVNDINSIHQRRWYLSLDRIKSGFIKTSRDKQTRWIPRSTSGQEQESSRHYRGKISGFQAFHVLGRDHERSIVTGRLARDILIDEGVEGYIPRGLWRAVTE